MVLLNIPPPSLLSGRVVLGVATRLSHRRSYPCTGLVRLPLQVREVDSGIFVSSGQLLLLFWQYRGDGHHVAGEYEITSCDLGGRNVHGWLAADTRCAHTQSTQNTRQDVYNVDLQLSGAATTVAVTAAPGDSATTVVARKKQTLKSNGRRSSDTGLFINHLNCPLQHLCSMHDLVLALWTCQIRQGMALCRTLGREKSECHASVLVEALCKRVIDQSTHQSFDTSVRS